MDTSTLTLIHLLHLISYIYTYRVLTSSFTKIPIHIFVSLAPSLCWWSKNNLIYICCNLSFPFHFILTCPLIKVLAYFLPHQRKKSLCVLSFSEELLPSGTSTAICSGFLGNPCLSYSFWLLKRNLTKSLIITDHK